MMKKCIFLFLILAMIFTLTACQSAPETSETTDTSVSSSISSMAIQEGFIAPDDETSATKTFTVSNEDGLSMEITIYGYTSESLNETFYVKSNEYFIADVKITNTSDQMYQQTTLPCYSDIASHNHKLELDIKDANGHTLASGNNCFLHYDLLRPWFFQENTTEEWHLKLAAGEERYVMDQEKEPEKAAEIDLLTDGQDFIPLSIAGIKLYDKNIYINNTLDFSGTISFPYSIFNATDSPNDRMLVCDISVKVMYIPFEK